MSLAVKISLLAAGLFLLTGMLIGIVKYRRIMTSAEHQAPVYIDIAHRAAFMYSFAALVIAQLVQYSPFSTTAQLVAVGVPLFYFAVTIAQYFRLGLRDETDNQFRERSFLTTWGMYGLIAGEIGGLAALVWGFVSTQLLAG